MSDLEKRLDDLEVRYSFQGEFINKLNTIIIEQQDKITEITEFLKHSKQSAEGEDQNSSLKDERPPHY